jgi:hypothetical protein
LLAEEALEDQLQPQHQLFLVALLVELVMQMLVTEL